MSPLPMLAGLFNLFGRLQSATGPVALCCLVIVGCEDPDPIMMNPSPDASPQAPVDAWVKQPPREAPERTEPDEDDADENDEDTLARSPRTELSNELRRSLADPGTAERACQDYRILLCEKGLDCGVVHPANIDEHNGPRFSDSLLGCTSRPATGSTALHLTVEGNPEIRGPLDERASPMGKTSSRSGDSVSMGRPAQPPGPNARVRPARTSIPPAAIQPSRRSTRASPRASLG